MVRVWYALILLICSIALCPALAAERVALVIGNGAYAKVPALPNPPHDAADMAHALERLGFKVTLLNDATADAMRKALVAFGQSAEGSSIAVVFYAGHGLEAGGENWLIPTDAQLRSDTDVDSEAISLKSVTLQVSKATKLGLVMLDACRNNPFEAKMKRSLSTRAVMRGLAPVEPSENVLIAYAARDGTTANDGDGYNSPFTGALLRNIETPGLEVSFLFRRVRDDVMAATHREQQPFVYGSLSKEEIYLKPAPVAVSQPSTADQGITAVSENDQFWGIVQDSSKAELYQEFVLEYPNSRHVQEARERIKTLSKQNEAMAAPSNSGSPPDQASKPTVRSLFTDEDAKRVDALGAELGLKIPLFSIKADQIDPSNPYSKFVGVWTNKRGWNNGKGRRGMLIITDASSTGWIYGHYLWGPPTKGSWIQAPAGARPLVEKVSDDSFTLNFGDTIVVRLNKNNSMSLVSTREGKPTERSKIELQPVWQLANINHAAGDFNRGNPSPPNLKKESRSPSVTRSGNVGSNGTTSVASGPVKETTSDESRCNRMADKLACLCAVRNGGGFSPDGKRWYSKRGGSSAPTNEAFVQCQLRAGR